MSLELLLLSRNPPWTSLEEVLRWHRGRPLGPLGPAGFDFSQHGPTTRPSVGRTADKAFSLSDREKGSAYLEGPAV